jgi:hypothetical protein
MHSNLSFSLAAGKPAGGMAPGMDFLQLASVDRRVNSGGFKFLLAEQLLDVPEVRAAFEHVRCARVAGHMATSFSDRPAFSMRPDAIRLSTSALNGPP